MPVADLLNDVSRLQTELANLPLTLKLRSEHDRLVLGRLQDLEHSRALSPVLRNQINVLLSIEFDALSEFESRIIASLEELEVFGVTPAFMDTDTWFTFELLGSTRASLEYFTLPAHATLADWIDIRNRHSGSSEPSTALSPAAPATVRWASLPPDDRPYPSIGLSEAEPDLRDSMAHLRPVFLALGLRIDPAAAPSSLSTHADDAGEAPRTPATQQTDHPAIRAIADGYREALARNQPASINGILAQAEPKLGEDLQSLRHELLAIWFADSVENYADIIQGV
jgi:hypothetical protein